MDQFFHARTEMIHIQSFSIPLCNSINQLYKSCYKDKESNNHNEPIATALLEHNAYHAALFSRLPIFRDITFTEQYQNCTISDECIRYSTQRNTYPHCYAFRFLSIIVWIVYAFVYTPNNITYCTQKNDPDKYFADRKII